jgi:hypothetical protein
MTGCALKIWRQKMPDLFFNSIHFPWQKQIKLFSGSRRPFLDPALHGQKLWYKRFAMKNEGAHLGLLGFTFTFLMALVSAQAQQTATATAVLTGNFVTSVNVTFGGSGYTNPPAVTFSGGGGSGAGAYATISGGAVVSVIVTNAGSAYTSVPLVTIDGPIPVPPYTSSMILNLPMDGTVVDTGPYHFTVVTNGSGTFVPDRFGFVNAAFTLNGVNQNIVLPYNSLLFPTEYTISVWTKFNQNTATIWNSGNSVADSWRGYDLSFLSPQQCQFQDYNGTTYDAKFTFASTNLYGWTHIVLTRTTSSAALFLNGVKINSQTGVTPYAKPQVAPLSFGANNGGGPFFNYCPVTFDSIHIYNRALSDSEVQSLFSFESMNTNQVPFLNEVVKTLRINMSQLVINYTYQLQATADFITWTNVGDPFTATNSSAYQDFDIINTGQGNFRVLKL